MSRTLTKPEKERLGLVGWKAGRVHEVELPSPEVARGFTDPGEPSLRGLVDRAIATDPTVRADELRRCLVRGNVWRPPRETGGNLAWALVRAGDFRPVHAPPLARIGFEMEVSLECPTAVRVVSREREPFEIRFATNEVESWMAEEDGPPERIVELEPNRPVLVLRARRRGVVLRRVEETLEIRPVTPPVLEIEPLAEVRVPVGPWLGEAGDPWLASEVRERLALGDSWSRAVAAGRWFRLRESTSEEAKAALAAVSEGRSIRETGPLEEWLARATEGEIRTIEDLTLAMAERLHATIDDLERDLDVDDEAWRERLLELAHARDDAASATVLLAKLGRAERADAVLAAVDREARLLLASSPRAVTFADERLRRVFVGEPDAWWGSLFTAEDE